MLYGSTRFAIPSVASLLAIAVLTFTSGQAEAARCLFISSYHQGYAWSDGVERGLRSVLDGNCEVRQFDMDTKRKKSKEDKQKAALEAKEIIESWKPDIVIVADDNAAKYVVQPFYKDHEIPFVFCGVNWTVDEYGFPYRNVTGMVEIAPIRPMLERAQEIVPNAKRVFYLGANTLTEEKNLKRFQDITDKLGLSLDHALVPTGEAWLEAYRRAQDYDFVVLGSNAGIAEWDPNAIVRGVKASASRLSVTNHGWMMPYTVLGVTKVPEEHGEWAAKTALRILDGMVPGDIPIVANTRRDLWINESILAAADIRLPKALMRRAKRVVPLEEQS